MSHHDQSWNRLSDLARRAPAGAAALEMPAGLSTRVVAQWLAERREVLLVSPWETFALRALAVACLITVLAAAAAWPVVVRDPVPEVADVADPVSAEVLP
ncbi:MAG: hypothetical protein IAE82_11295 [Opitutaceae bacterium]|nr:hypothetical protein [Opitutaceae bacterium]